MGYICFSKLYTNTAFCLRVCSHSFVVSFSDSQLATVSFLYFLKSSWLQHVVVLLRTIDRSMSRSIHYLLFWYANLVKCGSASTFSRVVIKISSMPSSEHIVFIKVDNLLFAKFYTIFQIQQSSVETVCFQTTDQLYVLRINLEYSLL